MPEFVPRNIYYLVLEGTRYMVMLGLGCVAIYLFFFFYSPPPPKAFPGSIPSPVPSFSDRARLDGLRYCAANYSYHEQVHASMEKWKGLSDGLNIRTERYICLTSGCSLCLDQVRCIDACISARYRSSYIFLTQITLTSSLAEQMRLVESSF